MQCDRQERQLLPLEKHCCIPGLACSFKFPGSIQPSPLLALQEAGGTANPPAEHGSRPEQTHLQNHTGPPLASTAPSTPSRAGTSLYTFCSSRGLKTSLAEICPLQRHEPAKAHASGSCLWLHPGKIIPAYNGSLMPPLLGGPNTLIPVLGKGGKGQSKSQEHIFPLPRGMPSYPPRTWPLIKL